MKRRLCLFSILVILSITMSSLAAESEGEVTKIFERVSVRSQFQLALNNYFEEKKPTVVGEGQVAVSTPSGSKSVAKSVLFSAALPGAGQFYTGSYIKGFAFAIVEAATLIGYMHFNNRGNDFEAEFEQFADAHWYEDIYWERLQDEREKDPLVDDMLKDQSRYTNEEWMQLLRDWERENFSHTLPQSKNQQYYENISKYNQFNVGWEDTKTWNGRDSDKRSQYTAMRKDANDAFKRATNLATLTMLNHVVSAFDAGFTAKRKNRTLMKASLGVQGRLHRNQVIPALSLDVRW
ncbi:hypothetical protein MJD09_12695 [bacterium]|nr:hypothetical protein [bacterium]